MSEFFYTGTTASLLQGEHAHGVMFLSIAVAIINATAAMKLTSMTRESGTPDHRYVAFLTGALALGCGVWSMHFIGMLAFNLPTPVRYDPLITGLSFLPAMVAAAIALGLLTRETLSRTHLVTGGILIGAGIGMMHYGGMMAMTMNAELRFEPWTLALSLLVTVGLSILAVWVGVGLQRSGRLLKLPAVLLGGMTLGLAMSGMHYLGMRAARFIGTPDFEFTPDHDARMFMTLAIATVTLTCGAIALAVSGLLRYRRLYRDMEHSTARTQAILDTAVDGVITIDRRGAIQSFNRSAERIFGWRAEEVIGRNVNVLMPAPYHDEHDGYLDNYLTSGKAKIIGIGRDVTACRRDGSTFPIRLAIGAVQHLRETLFVGFVTDISQRVAMETALREREQQLRTLMGNIPGAAFRCLDDARWTMLFLSDGIEQLTGWPAGRFLDGGLSVADLLPPEDLADLHVRLAAAMTGGDSYTMEYRMRRRDGALRWVSESTTVVRGADGAPQWLDGVMLDITERKEMELALQDAKARAESAMHAKGRFLANMSHEIRTPMNAILGFTEVLLDSKLDGEQARHLRTIHQSARSLLHLLNDILDTAKLEQGALELDEVDFSLRELCEQVCASLRLQAQRKGLQLELCFAPEIGDYARGDPLRLQQVLLNLLGNAVKFTRHGHVRLLVGGRPGHMTFDVEDTGIGIPAERLAHIFEPFSQADASITRRFGGTGLGTTIARQLVERMGGDITVRSVEGEGSTFSVVLPLAAGRAPAGIPGGGLLKLPPLNILAVDDVPQNLELLRVLFGRDGHRVDLAEDGVHALAALERNTYDLVLMDLQMPELDGLAATRRLREREREAATGSRRTPVIALSAGVLESDRSAARRAGCDGFAAKPVDLPALHAEIAQALGLEFSATAASTTHSQSQASAIDQASGNLRWGDSDSHLAAVTRFVESEADSASRIRAHLANGDADAARALAHRLRGAAGNLSLPELEASARGLERCLSQSQAADCAALTALIDRAFAGIQAALPQPAAATAGQPPAVAAGPLGECTARLEAAFARGEFPQDDLETVLGMLPAEHTEALRLACEQFDFDAARDALHTLQNWIERSPA